MPTLKRPAVLAVIYQAADRLILTGRVPTSIIPTNHSIYRSVPVRYCPKPAAADGHVSKATAGQALMPRDGASEMNNRFSGPSGNGAIPSSGGLYCVLQQQALVNEIRHYAKAPVHTAFADKCVIRIRLMAPVQCVDLSPHNPGHQPFLKDLTNAPGVKAALKGADLWKEITDGEDCSVACGIGLAAANSVYRGLVAETVRDSERSIEEKGDNLILFGDAMKTISNLYIDEAYFFDDSAHTFETFPVQFP